MSESVKSSFQFDIDTTQMCHKSPGLLAEDVLVCMCVWMVVRCTGSHIMLFTKLLASWPPGFDWYYFGGMQICP